MCFLKYPKSSLPQLQGYFLLSLDGPLLSKQDASLGLFLIDATWRYAAIMTKFVLEKQPVEVFRSLPKELRTAYPRRQEDCEDPARGLASVEALYTAYTILGRDTAGILDHYYWKDSFLSLNSAILSRY